jgi:hypothetical protein
MSAQDPSNAMLRSNAVGVFLNDNPAPAATALFRDDVIRTEKNAAARIEINGSSADIGPETIVQFEGDELVLDHGAVSVNSSRGLRVRVGCLTVTPVNDALWTRYDVTDMNSKVTVSALKSDVYIDEHSKKQRELDVKQSRNSGRSMVHETERKTREDKCGGGYLNPSDSPAGKGALLNSPWAIATGAAVVGTLTCLGLCHGDDPLSPSTP